MTTATDAAASGASRPADVRHGAGTDPATDPRGAAADGRRPVRRALVSVSDKTGLVALAEGLHAAGVAIVSTGSTARTIAAAGVPVTGVEEVTGFPEALDGRVKTLHPGVHAGILADTRRPEHVGRLAELGIEAFELVVVNLYPFEATVASGADRARCVEQIDVGGPAMVRAAAKNAPSVAVVTDPGDYDDVLAAVAAGGTTADQRDDLAARAFAATAAYDVAVATWFAGARAAATGGPPAFVATAHRLRAPLRYGENPHQGAAVYVPAGRDPRSAGPGAGGAPAGPDGASAGPDGASAGGLAAARQLHGKEMSYNNYVDTDAARRAAFDLEGPAVAIVKHANPCGVAQGEDVAAAHAAALACDPVSAFGGVVATTRLVSVAMAEQVARVFTEVVVAPGYEDGALEVLRAKKNVRLLVAPPPAPGPRREARAISGGLLVQDADVLDADGDDPSTWTLAAGPAADEATLADLVFAWRAVRAVRSNAILLARDRAAVGVGMGQVNRVDSCRLAVERANTLGPRAGRDGPAPERARGSVAASDAFFPFADGLRVLLDAGVRAVVQPGGSVRDAEVVAAAEAAGATMYLTGARHFAH